MENLPFDKKRSRVKQCPCGKSNKDGKFVPYTGFELKGYCHSCGKLFLPDKNSLPEAPNAYLYKTRKGESVFKRIVTKLIPSNKAAPLPLIRQLAENPYAQLRTPYPGVLPLWGRNEDGAVTKIFSNHPFNLVKQSCKNYGHNNFATYLNTLFTQKITTELLHRYHIGTSKHWNGATVFWQIDINNRVRAGKIMLYHPTTGKRVKEPFSHIAWVHSVLKLTDYNLHQCFFGEHLLKQDKHHPIAIVESEKTAVIASVHLPQFIWLATGSVSNLTEEKCRVLRGRHVVLFPDANAFDKWSARAKELSHITRFTVSDLLEKNTTSAEKLDGVDLGDYLG